MIDTDGHIVYTVTKEADFATDLVNGPYRDRTWPRHSPPWSTRLREVSRIVDFAPYAPSYSARRRLSRHRSTTATSASACWRFQMPIAQIDRVMTGDRDWSAEGLGETGETFLVGEDFKMRSNSRLILEDPAGYLAAAEKAGMSPSELRANPRVRHHDPGAGDPDRSDRCGAVRRDRDRADRRASG